MLYRDDLLQDNSTGEMFTYLLYELNSKTHILVGCDGVRIRVSDSCLLSDYTKIEFHLPRGY